MHPRLTFSVLGGSVQQEVQRICWRLMAFGPSLGRCLARSPDQRRCLLPGDRPVAYALGSEQNINFHRERPLVWIALNPYAQRYPPFSASVSFPLRVEITPELYPVLDFEPASRSPPVKLMRRLTRTRRDELILDVLIRGSFRGGNIVMVSSLHRSPFPQ
jgi:hypothetical protein